MPDLSGRKLYLVKRPLAKAIAALEHAPNTHFKPIADIEDMKEFLAELIPSDMELAMYTRSARMALRGEGEP